MGKGQPPTWSSRVKWFLLVAVPGTLVFLATNKAEDVLDNLNSWLLLLGLASLSTLGTFLLADDDAGPGRRGPSAMIEGSRYVLAVCVFALAIKGTTLVV